MPSCLSTRRLRQHEHVSAARMQSEEDLLRCISTRATATMPRLPYAMTWIMAPAVDVHCILHSLYMTRCFFSTVYYNYNKIEEEALWYVPDLRASGVIPLYPMVMQILPGSAYDKAARISSVPPARPSREGHVDVTVEGSGRPADQLILIKRAEIGSRAQPILSMVPQTGEAR